MDTEDHDFSILMLYGRKKLSFLLGGITYWLGRISLMTFPQF